MKKRTYLLDKLAEEAAEVAQAAIKHKHKGTAKSKRRLEAEVGQLRAFMMALTDSYCLSLPDIIDSRCARTRVIETKLRTL